MLSQEQIQERNAYLMNTEPGTLINISTTEGDSIYRAEAKPCIVKYKGYYPRQDAFRIYHPSYTEGLPLYEESEIWDFEVQNA